MQYGELITRAFTIVWRHKYLWLLAILGGADVTTSSGFGANFNSLGGAFNGGGSGSPSGTGGTAGTAGLRDVLSMTGQFIQDHAAQIALAGLGALVVVIAWTVLSCVTTGALVRSAAEHDAERPFGLGLAWRTGVGTFWTILGLRLLGLLWGAIVLGAVAGVVVLGIMSYLGGQGGAAVGTVVTLGALLVGVLALASIPIGIAFILGTRAAVLEQRGPLSALGRGFGLLRARLGRALLVWLIQVGLSLAAGFGLAFALIPVLLLVAAVLVGAGVAGGVGAVIAVAIPLGLLLLVLALVLGGIVGAYLSTYWTLAFRRMEVDAPQPVAWPQTPYGAR
jgi:hypothetical protein